jgi:Ca2+:H+ antiporter
LFVGLGTAAIFFGTGSRLVEIVAHPVRLIVVFLWLFAVILWSAVSVARHADCLAIKWGEPYGTLVLTLSAITIEVVMVFYSDVAWRKQSYPWAGLDFFVIMIALTGLSAWYCCWAGYAMESSITTCRASTLILT